MAKTINKVDLLGRTGADPEMRYTQNETAVTKVRLATDRPRQNGDMETDWHTVICWGKLAESVNEYVGKGHRLYVAGRLVQNSWETKDGQRRHRTEVHAEEVIFLDPRKGKGDGKAVVNGGQDVANEDLPF